MEKERNREAGILLSVTSLPSPYGIGCLSEDALRWVDFLRDSGQRVWQILPMGPTGYGDSPYQPFSSFGGNPYWIDLAEAVQRGWLYEAECERLFWGADSTRVDYGRIYEGRRALLRLAYERGGQEDREQREDFEQSQADWLEDFALFMAWKEREAGRPWYQWEEGMRLRRPEALQRGRSLLQREIDYHKWVQFLFFRQWERLHRYAGEQGIRIMGDLPIYVAEDSADLWSHPELFLLDGLGRPLRVAGCPPDEFSPMGQLWGNPLYRWERHREEGYAWWIRRIGRARELYDLLRIDHFRGFDAYYSIPFGAADAREGRWEEGPGRELFRAVEKALGRGETVAEDLGYLTDSVRRLVRDCGFDGMKILQFGLCGGDAEHDPLCYPYESVAYSGTHDNPTLCQWLKSRSEADWERLREELWDFYTPRDAMGEVCLARLMAAPSRLCMVPLQDYLGLGEEGRMNRPGAPEGNWSWRVTREELTEELKNKIRRLTKSGRRM